MPRFRPALLATLIALCVATFAFAASGIEAHVADASAEQARSTEASPSTPRDALAGERIGAAQLLRRFASERGEPRSDALLVSAMLASVATLAIAAQGRLRLWPSFRRDAFAVALIPARGPPLHLA